jgi:hypothetical protein
LYSSNGANLKLDKTAGTIMKRGINATNDIYNPHVLTITSETILSFTYTLYDSTFTLSQVNIDPDNYDLNGTLTSVSSNYFTIQRVGILYDGSNIIQYGNAEYATLILAQTALNGNIELSFPVEQNISNASISQYLIVKQSSTDLSDTSVNKIIKVDLFGKPDKSSIGALESLLADNNLSDITTVATARVNLGAGIANGLATLDGSVLIPDAQISTNIARVIEISQLCHLIDDLSVDSIAYQTLSNFTFISSEYSNLSNCRIMVHVTIADRNLLFNVYNLTTAGSVYTSTISSTNFYSVTFTKPSVDSLLQFQFKKSTSGGTDPIVKGLVIKWY